MKNLRRLTLLLATALPAQEPATEPIFGRIVTLRGEPAPAMPVEVTTWQAPDTVLARGITDGDGCFHIARVPVTPGRQLRAGSRELCVGTHRVSGARAPQILLAHDAATVRGVLRDRRGAPVPDAVVRGSPVSRVMGDVAVDAVTDAEGRFSVAGVPLGTVRFQAVVPDEGIALAIAQVAGACEVEVRTADMATTTLRITARGLPDAVLPQLSAMVLPDADRTLDPFPPPWDRARFGADGTWSLAPVPDCRYRVYLFADGYVFAPRSYTLDGGSGPHELVFDATPAQSSRLACKVVATDREGEPVPGVTFRMRASNGGASAQATSGDDGAMEFLSPLARGEQAVVYALDDRWVTDQPPGDVAGGSDARDATWHRFTVDPDEPVAVRLVPACEVAGRVVLADGRPAAFARLHLEEEQANRTPRWMEFDRATANRDGTFRFRRLHPMRQALRVSIEGSQGTFVGGPFALDSAGQEVTLGELRLSPAAVVEGVVRTADREVAPGRRVWLRGWDMATGRPRNGGATETVTDRHGRFRFRGVPEGGAWLQTLGTRDPRAEDLAVEPFEVEAGKTYTLDVELPEGV